MSLAIELDHVGLAMGARSVLADANFAITEGEFIGVLGPNGSGKTTLMRALLGLVRPFAGTIKVLGTQVTARGNPAIGYMPQSRSLAGATRLSAFDFVAAAFKGEKWGMPVGRFRQAEVERVIAAVGAEELSHRPIAELSGGQRQRLLIAQALLGRPRILLLDEPLISLDIHHQQAIVALVDDLRRKLGLTILFSAHEVNPLLSVMDRVLFLGSGAAAIGSIEDVVRPEILSRLYGTEVDVVHLDGRVFVLAAGESHDGHDHHHH